MDTEFDLKKKELSIIHNKSELAPVHKTNAPRMRAFDLARGIAIVAMVLIHTIVFLGDPELLHTIPGYLANSIICIIAAPVFTFIMGVMIAFSSKSSVKNLLLRGLVILAVGYLLNFIRGTLPIAFGEWAGWIDYQDERPWMYMLEQDILQFAGIAFLFVAFFKRLNISNIGMAILGGAIIVASPLLYKLHLDGDVQGYLVSLLFGGSSYNFFPVIPWIVFPLIGIGYGELLKRSTDKSIFMQRSLLAGLIVMVAGFVIIVCHDKELLREWYHGEYRQGMLPWVISLIFTGFQFVWMPVCYLISEKIKKSRILNLLYHWSANVTWFYAIQWVIIGWACLLLPPLSWIQVIIAALLITVLTDRVMLSFIKNKGAVRT